MRPLISRALVFVYAALAALILVGSGVAQKPADDQSEVIRITTELVQTGVVVLDKQGRFVEGLKPGQFQLRVDGKPVELSFLERVTAGTAGEEKLESAARRGVAVGGIGDSRRSFLPRTNDHLLYRRSAPQR